jgi:hypothetical protein
MVGGASPGGRQHTHQADAARDLPPILEWPIENLRVSTIANLAPLSCSLTSARFL